MKKILGIDIGTNSIGWAYIQRADNETEENKILGMGSRIISLGEDKTNFEQGKALTRNAKKREKKGSRKLNKRYKQRRNKLLFILNALNILPDFIKVDGDFPESIKLQKLNIKPIAKESKQLTAIELFELRKQALYKKIEDIQLESNPDKKITLKDFGRLIYLFNQSRGYAGGETEENDKDNKKESEPDQEKESVKKEFETVIISAIQPKQKVDEIKKGKGENATIEEVPLYRIKLMDINSQKKYNGECYKELLPETELQVEIIMKSDQDEYPFFNNEGVERKRAKPKGGLSETITAKILLSEKPQDFKNKKWLYNLELKDGRKGILSLKNTKQAESFKANDEKELQITTIADENGNVTYEFALPFKSSWRKQMEDLEKDLKEKGDPHLGKYFYNKLKEDKWYKVRTRVILRNRYKKEFDAIWEQQARHYSFLNNTDKNTLKTIADYLFPGTSASQNRFREEAIKKGLKYIIKEQIIYYQRKLKPQFRLIGICQFETNPPLKVIPESHPLHQEKKIWEGINALSINTVTYVNETKVYDDKLLTSNQKETLYNLLQEQKELSHSAIRTRLILRDKIDWLNGLHVKSKLKGNTTLLTIKNSLSKVSEDLFNKLGLNDRDKLIAFWRILYNWIKKEYEDVQINIADYEKNPTKYHEYDINSDNEYDINSERCKEIKKFIEQNDIQLSDEQIKNIAKIRFKRAYSSLSAKAINNILPLMRAGKYFIDEINIIPEKAKENIRLLEGNAENILEAIENGETNSPFDKSLLEHFLKDRIRITFYEGGMMYSDAATLIYGKHTAEETKPEDSKKNYHEIKTFFKRKEENPDDQNNYLRNPVVEQIADETLQLIYSIWKHYMGKPDEIRIELARELKNNAEQREKIWEGIRKGEKINNYVRQRLIDLKRTLPPEHTIEIERSEPSFANIEKYKLWSKQVIEKEPDRKEIEKYRLWEEQRHLSPYTLRPIPLSYLFSKGYDVDHIIPKSRYFDDSLTNKVVCEAIVNEEKGNRTPYEYLKAGSILTDEVKEWETFSDHVNEIFFGAKRKNLLAREIPKDFIERQIKETQYVSIKVKEELGKIIGTRNVKTTTGGVTDNLRQQWGLNDKFKEITKSRYEAMAKMAGKEDLVRYEFDEKRNKNILKIDIWSKRHDHRHHAIDALVVACTEQSHVQQLNNLNKNFQSWFGEFDLFLDENKIEELQQIKNSGAEEVLIAFSKIGEEKRRAVSKEIIDSIIDKQKNKIKQRGDWEKWFNAFSSLALNEKRTIQETMPGFRKIDKPWKDFYKDHQIEKVIDSIIISHKPNKRLLIQKRKDRKTRTEMDELRIRGELHEGTLYGTVNGMPTYRIKLSSLGSSQKTKAAVLTNLENIVSKNISGELKVHLNNYNGNHTKAFSAEGIDEFNRTRKENGKHPVFAIKVIAEQKPAEDILQKLYRDKTNDSLYVKTGSNYCFAIAEKEGKRKFGVLTFFDAVNLIKNKKDKKTGKFTDTVDEVVKKYFDQECETTKGNKLLFTLSINDMVYLPGDNEIVPMNKSVEGFDTFWKSIDRKRIYKVIRMDSIYCYFSPHTMAEELEFVKQSSFDNESKQTEVKEDNQVEESVNTKAIKYKEYGTYGGCSPFVLNENFIAASLGKKEKNITKKELSKKADEILINISKNKLTENNSEIEDELITQLSLLIIDNSQINLLDYLKKKDKDLFEKIKMIAKDDLNKNKLDQNLSAFKPIKIQDTCIKLNVDRLGNIFFPSKQNPYSPASNQQNILNEPKTMYEARSVSGSASFDDMEQDQLKYFASLSPEELLRNHKQLSLAAFGLKGDAGVNKPDRTIKFDKEE